ncbi:heme-binding protein [Gemmatimonas sp.]|uniref:GlcG/HbpS family heme-binding protein n=1 Tax=Gemmatimonas sp. TaxID=1962908 RepID=UPI00286A348F|nr:heme-binding protein [Gemmatimonas sp.]
MRITRCVVATVSIAALLVSAPRVSAAQLADTKMLTADAVKSLLLSAEATAKQNKWNVSIAITDAAGDLLGFLKLDNASTGSVQIAQGKARTAARFGRPTKVYADRILSDTLTFLSVDGLVALQGGLPILIGGKVIGAVGVSGATSAQDEQVAATAIAAVIKL